MKVIKSALFILGVLLVAVSSLFATTEAEQKYEPTEVQTLRLQVKQKDAIIAQSQIAMAQTQLNAAQAHFQEVLASLNAEADKVKADNKWDKDKVVFDPQALVFKLAAPTATPKK